MNICADYIFGTADHFDTKLGMVMKRCEPECHAEKVVRCLQCRGHSEGSYVENMTICAVSSKLLVGLQPDLV